MNRITYEENRLFNNWANGRESFVKDGVVDSNQYERSCVKLLFVLKEVNDPDGGGWDLRQFLRDGAVGSTWNTVTRWIRGIYGLPDIVAWDELFEVDEDLRKKWLSKIAVINLKKEPGAGSTNERELRNAVQRDREFISCQFSLYEPDYVICCGSIVTELIFAAKHNGVYPGNNKDWKSTKRGVWYCMFNGTPYIQYVHPRARYPDNLIHYGLVDTVMELSNPV